MSFLKIPFHRMGIQGRWSDLLHCPVWRAHNIHNMKASECLVWGIFDGSDFLDWVFNDKNTDYSSYSL